MRAEDILYFWFIESGPKRWWKKSVRFDALVKRRFLLTYKAAVRGELAHWRTTDRGRLAEIIVLDQFSRNMFRGKSAAFDADPVALVLAQEAVALDVGGARNGNWKGDWLQFLYMPYMHSESLSVHETAVQLFSKPRLVKNLEFEMRHKKIIERFGRYPHRNGILGRKSTVEELEFLKQPGSGF